MRGVFLLVIFISGSLTCVMSQDNKSGYSDAGSEYHDIGCFQRPKFFEINYRTLPSVRAYPSEYLVGNEEFERNRLIDMKLSLPLIMKDNFKLISQLKYKNEVLNLGENDFYERKVKLNNSGITLAYQWFYKDSRYIAGHISSSLKADQYHFSSVSSILDYNSSLVWGIKQGEHNLGFGVILGNSLGRFKIAPVFILEDQLNENWHISMKLPKELTLTRAIVPDNFYLKGSLETIGAAYYLNNPVDDFSNIEYRRSAIDFKLGLEKEIRDFLWAGVDVGVSQPLNSSLVEPGKPSRNKIYDFNHQFAPFVNFSIFAVPPRSLYRKIK